MKDEREDVAGTPVHDPAQDAAPDPAYDPAYESGHDAQETRHHGGFFGARHGDEQAPDPRPRRRRGFASCLVVLVVLALVGGGAALAVSHGIDRLQGLFAGPPDYSGDGTGSVMFQVQEGDSATTIGQNLEAADIVKSVEAFTDQADQDVPKARGIQVGYYRMHKQMSAEAAFAVLTDPANLVQSAVTVPEGSRVRTIVKTIVARTKISRADLTKALAHPERIGLPAEAHGNPEGYLFPATYAVAPHESAVDLLSAMVEKTKQVEEDLDVPSAAKALGLSTEQAFTVASILEYEANRPEDYPKVARVIYNRIDQGMPLQLDSTVAYASGREGDVWTTASERAGDSLYNTYKHQGLPPGPIGSPGEETLKAALHPADGNWLYFVPDFQHHTTLFTASYKQHLRNVAKAKEYCRTHQEC